MIRVTKAGLDCRLFANLTIASSRRAAFLFVRSLTRPTTFYLPSFRKFRCRDNTGTQHSCCAFLPNYASSEARCVIGGTHPCLHTNVDTCAGTGYATRCAALLSALSLACHAGRTPSATHLQAIISYEGRHTGVSNLRGAHTPVRGVRLA